MSRLRAACTTAMATAAVTVLAAVPSSAAPEPGGVAALLTQLKTLYQQAEAAGEAYNTTEQALLVQRAKTARAGGGLAEARAALERSRSAAGALARAQYRGTPELSGYLQLLLSDDPERAVEQQHMLARAARGTLATEGRLAVGKQRADAAAAASGAALATQQRLTALKRQQRDTAESKLRQVESLLAALPADRLAQLAALDRSGTEQAQQNLVDSGALGPQGRAARPALPTAAGAAALRYAVEQIGKPYAWGAAGPTAYDGSGLASGAWAHAGVPVPRTSEEQWRTLPRVPLDRLRPGDLVVYFPRATHVAVYLGNGKVVQVPRPGARVKVSPIAANPLLGAVRPDPTGVALSPSAYRPPVLPAGAEDGPDTVSDTAAPPV
ncbi:C40 family peptidase [Streptomyces sp. NBC_01497]|uniref:C40 family peptidase n=1 Tax=Streptomyces sp. NBC_01497 TaxID=2903885 RepID=UPI002E3022B9|nr:NlpC/P60 family protein [Streptomyces sp. NBC_01497]